MRATFYRLHSALGALLQAYLPTRADKEWRVLCEDFAWPPVFPRGWTEAVRCTSWAGAIAATAGDALHVKRLDVPSWAQFLQILEDTGPAWMVDVLCRPAAQSITAREALKNLLTATDPGGDVSVSGGLDVGT